MSKSTSKGGIFEPREDRTDEAVRDPRVGDRYTEMYTFELFVVHVDRDTIATLECTRPAEMPRDGELKIQTKEEFRKRLAYGSIPGYWVDLAGRGFNVKGWYEYAYGIPVPR